MVVASITVVIQLDVPVPVVYVEDYYQPLFISKYLFNLPQPSPPLYTHSWDFLRPHIKPDSSIQLI